jgi:hypothetical protein
MSSSSAGRGHECVPQSPAYPLHRKSQALLCTHYVQSSSVNKTAVLSKPGMQTEEQRSSRQTVPPDQNVKKGSTQKERSGGVTMECKHNGCTAKLVIYGAKDKQVIGAHTHVLCQRNCWTCRNFVDAYMNSNDSYCKPVKQ